MQAGNEQTTASNHKTVNIHLRAQFAPFAPLFAYIFKALIANDVRQNNTGKTFHILLILT
jgi:hypothetical protein